MDQYSGTSTTDLHSTAVTASTVEPTTPWVGVANPRRTRLMHLDDVA